MINSPASSNTSPFGTARICPSIIGSCSLRRIRNHALSAVRLDRGGSFQAPSARHAKHTSRRPGRVSLDGLHLTLSSMDASGNTDVAEEAYFQGDVDESTPSHATQTHICAPEEYLLRRSASRLTAASAPIRSASSGATRAMRHRVQTPSMRRKLMERASFHRFSTGVNRKVVRPNHGLHPTACSLRGRR